MKRVTWMRFKKGMPFLNYRGEVCGWGDTYDGYAELRWRVVRRSKSRIHLADDDLADRQIHVSVTPADFRKYRVRGKK